MAVGFHQVAIATVRDYWDARPCNVNHSRKPVGERDYYLEVRARKHFVEPHIPGFADFAAWAGKRVLAEAASIGR